MKYAYEDSNLDLASGDEGVDIGADIDVGATIDAGEYIDFEENIDAGDDIDVVETIDMSPDGRSQAFASQWFPNDDGLQLNSDCNEEEDIEAPPTQNDAAAADRAKQAQLLALLNINRGAHKPSAAEELSRRTKSQTPQAQQQLAEPKTAAGAEEAATGMNSMPPLARPMSHSGRNPARSPSASMREANWIQDDSVAQDKLDLPQSQPNPSSIESLLQKDAPERTDDSPSTREAHWLQGYIVTDATTKISQRQRERLKDNAAWHKPPAGKSVVHGNIPIEVFQDVEATFERNLLSLSAEGENNERRGPLEPPSDSLDQTQASCRQTTQTDSNKTSTGEQTTQSEPEAEAEAEEEEQEQEPQSSPMPVSWPSSPVQEIERWHPGIQPNLPPDSSFENAQLPPRSSPPALPASSPVREQPPAVEQTESDIREKFAIRPSQATTQTEDDDDLEVDIPLALGEDEDVHYSPKSPKAIVMSKRTRVASIVQVEETPASKLKSGELVKSVQGVDSSSGTSNDTSIVHATYMDMSSSAGKAVLSDRSPNIPRDGAGDLAGPQSGTQEPGEKEMANGFKKMTAEFAESSRLAVQTGKPPEAVDSTSPPPEQPARAHTAQPAASPNIARAERNISVSNFSFAKPGSPLKRKASGSPMASTHRAKNPKFALGQDFRPKRGSFNIVEEPSKEFEAYMQRRGSAIETPKERSRQTSEHRETRMQDVDSPSSERPNTSKTSKLAHGSHRKSPVQDADSGAQNDHGEAPLVPKLDTGKQGHNEHLARPKANEDLQPSKSLTKPAGRRHTGPFFVVDPTQEETADVSMDIDRPPSDGETSLICTYSRRPSVDKHALQAEYVLGQMIRSPCRGDRLYTAEVELPAQPDKPGHNVPLSQNKADTAIRDKTDTLSGTQARSSKGHASEGTRTEAKAAHVPIASGGENTRTSTDKTNMPVLNTPTQTGPAAPWMPEPPSAPTSAQQDRPEPTALETVYARFKQAYPTYKGNEKHFHSMCKQIHKHQKSLHKILWDDFVFKSRTVYKEYTDECLEEGTDAMPYLQYYNEKVSDIDYREGVLKNIGVLLMAIRESGPANGSASVSAQPSPGLTPSTMSPQLAQPSTQGAKTSSSMLPPKLPAAESSNKRKIPTATSSSMASRSRKSLSWQETSKLEMHPRRSSGPWISPPPPKRTKTAEIPTATRPSSSRASLSNLPDLTPSVAASSLKQKDPHRRHTTANLPPSAPASASANSGQTAPLDSIGRNTLTEYARSVMRTKSITGSGKGR